MTRRAAKRDKRAIKKPIESYDHQDKKRANNPPVGLVTPETDPDAGRKTTYKHDPQLVWAGKPEHTGCTPNKVAGAYRVAWASRSLPV